MEAHGSLPKCRDTLQRCAQCFVDGGKLKYCNIALAGLCVVVLLLLVGVIYLAEIKLVCPPVAPVPQAPACPQGWVPNGPWCYFFSAGELNWEDSKRHCASLDGDLVPLETEVEKDFIMRSMEKDTYWIGLRRADVDQPWKLPNGSVFTSWFPVRGTGRCAYLNEDTVDSTWCINDQWWICRRPLNAS